MFDSIFSIEWKIADDTTSYREQCKTGCLQYVFRKCIGEIYKNDAYFLLNKIVQERERASTFTC